jgi:acyl-CoA thioesterase I
MDDVHRARTRIVIIGDSLCMPRPMEDGDGPVRLEQTWPRRLQRQLLDRDAEVVAYGQRERTTRDLANDLQTCVTFNDPEIVVLQIGVVDAAPRIISWRERRVLRFVPLQVREQFIDRRKSNRQSLIASDPLAKVYVPPDEFVGHLKTFVAAVHRDHPSCRLFALPIVADVPFMERKSPGYGGNVSLYNRLIGSVAGLHMIPLTMTNDDLMPDGYHLNVAGNAAVATAVAQHLRPHVAKKR